MLIRSLNMKALRLIIIMVSMITLSGCDKKGMSVDEYIALLKSGKYDSSADLPEFTSSDIPALLKYRNETLLITAFPRNPISSSLTQNCRLGIYVLWTIESIRAVATNSIYLQKRFPSQNPVLQLSNLSPVSDDQSHQIAAKAYFDWWEANNGKDFAAFKAVDPLQGTAYKWH